MRTTKTASTLYSLLIGGVLSFSGLLPEIALAEKRALLVGVSDYTHLPESLQLSGPVNDIEIVYATLRQHEFSDNHIQQLVTKAGHNLPTRKNILQALASLTEIAKADDFIYLHFAGHGSRQPARQITNDEADGLDEIFLPSDAKHWNNTIGSVENAIIDDEIALYVDSLRDKGADVWIVFDSCHSGTMTRSTAMPDLRSRQAPSHLIGVPPRHKTRTTTPPGSPDFDQWDNPVNPHNTGFLTALFNTDRQKTTAARGELVSFSAAQSTQETPELPLPRGNANRRTHGLFTYILMDVLNSNSTLSYQQLAQKVLARYESIPWRHSQPLFVATNINATVFGAEASGVKLFNAQLKRGIVHIRAGHLAMLSKGAEIALYSDAASEESTPLAILTINQADALNSSASTEMFDTVHWPETLYARLYKPALQTSLSISPLESREMNSQTSQTLQKQLLAITLNNPLIKLSPPNEANILVSQFAGRFWFLRADQTLPCDQQSISEQEEQRCDINRQPQPLLNIAIPPQPEEARTALSNSLMRIAQAEHVLSSTSHLTGAQQSLDITFRVKRQGAIRDLPINTRPHLQNNDQILFDIRNNGSNAQDVSILFIDSQYGITQLYPKHGHSNRLQPNDSLSFTWHINVSTVGVEHLVLSSQPGIGISQDLSELEQPPIQSLTRGASRAKLPSRGSLEIYSWHVTKQSIE